MTITYEKWVSDNKTDLQKLEGKDLIMAFSGGKDSSVVLHFLDLAKETFKYNLEARGIVIPEHVLTSDERNRLNQYWENRGIKLFRHSVSNADEKLKEAPTQGVSPCLICNKTKKDELMAVVRSAITKNLDLEYGSLT